MAADYTLYITIVGSDNGPIAQALKEKLLLKADHPRAAIVKLADFLQSIAGGSVDAKVHAALAGRDTGTAGTGTVVATQANASAGDTVRICDTTFTVRASPSTAPADGEFAPGASDDACGANLAAAINAHPNLKGLCTAANASGTVTITFSDKGLHANLATFATSDATAFAVTAPTNGAEGTLVAELRTYRRGL